MLLSFDMRDWLPQKHFVYFILEVVFLIKKARSCSFV